MGLGLDAPVDLGLLELDVRGEATAQRLLRLVKVRACDEVRACGKVRVWVEVRVCGEVR